MYEYCSTSYYELKDYASILFKDYMFQNGIDCVSYGLPLISSLDAFEEFKLNMPNSEKVKYNTIFFPLHPDFTIKDIKIN